MGIWLAPAWHLLFLMTATGLKLCGFRSGMCLDGNFTYAPFEFHLGREAKHT